MKPIVIPRMIHSARRRERHRGLTLVELLVATAISLVLVLAATAIYLATRDTQRTLDQASSAQESGSYALRSIGRDLMNAGFYPAVRTEVGGGNVLAGYANITGQAAYATGVFGCDGAKFDPATAGCGTAAAGAPDSLVIGYFTTDAFGTSLGQRADCTGTDVAAAGVNLARVGTGDAASPPALPLFVANHYRLVDGTISVDGRTVATRSLECFGNGSATWQPILQGIDDLQLTYAVFADVTRVADRFYTADEVAALGNATIEGQTVPPWARVIAVRVCVIARTYESSAAVGVTSSYTDCDGTARTGDSSVRKIYSQVFGLRNRETATY